jgi:hypothetical protein
VLCVTADNHTHVQTEILVGNDIMKKFLKYLHDVIGHLEYQLRAEGNRKLALFKYRYFAFMYGRTSYQFLCVLQSTNF